MASRKSRFSSRKKKPGKCKRGMNVVDFDAKLEAEAAQPDKPAVIDKDDSPSWSQRQFSKLLQAGKEPKKRPRSTQINKNKSPNNLKRLRFETDWQYSKRICGEIDTEVKKELMQIRDKERAEVAEHHEEQVKEKVRAKREKKAKRQASKDAGGSHMQKTDDQLSPDSKPAKFGFSSHPKHGNRTNLPRNDDILNCTERIPLGERADAPPDLVKLGFNSSKKAGAKNLLLKQQIQSSTKVGKKTKMGNSVSDEQRQAVIDGYRLLKKRRRQKLTV